MLLKWQRYYNIMNGFFIIYLEGTLLNIFVFLLWGMLQKMECLYFEISPIFFISFLLMIPIGYHKKNMTHGKLHLVREPFTMSFTYHLNIGQSWGIRSEDSYTYSLRVRRISHLLICIRSLPLLKVQEISLFFFKKGILEDIMCPPNWYT